MDKVLICYFSATGVTKSVAEKIANVVNADLFEIEPVEKYTSEDLDWMNKQSRSSIEMNENIKPEILNKVSNLDNYEKEFMVFCKEILQLYKKLNIVSPVVFFVSLTNIQGYNLYNHGYIRTYGSIPDKRQKLDPSGTIINNENEIEKKVKDLFQPLWNHYGLPENNTR